MFPAFVLFGDAMPLLARTPPSCRLHARVLLLWALVVALAATATAAPMDRLYLARDAHWRATAGDANGGDESDVNGALWFNQTLDHFNPADARVFAQRYYEDLSQFDAAAGGPVLLVICGESACKGIPNDFRMELASDLGAAVVALEHRFYGNSMPFGDLARESLGYLSANQALADLASFRQFYQDRLNKLFNGSSDAAGLHTSSSSSSSSIHESVDRQWVVTGVSYAGALSAWCRLEYPHLFHASIASAAVVHAIADFWEFEEQVVLSAGPACASVLRGVTYEVERQLEGGVDERRHVKERFKCGALPDDDFRFLLSDAAVFAFQYGRPDDLCVPLTRAQTHGEDTLSAYASYVSDVFFSHFGASPGDYNRFVLVNSSLAAPSAGMRVWLYQTCTQMGFFQTPARIAKPIRFAALSIEYYRDLCRVVFGDRPAALFPSTVDTNTFFGGSSIASSRIVFTHGSQDPWKRASKLRNSLEMPSLTITCHNCGHGVDMRGCPAWVNQRNSSSSSSSTADDAHAHAAGSITPVYDASHCANPSAVTYARGLIKGFLHSWLDRAIQPHTSAASAAASAASAAVL